MKIRYMVWTALAVLVLDQVTKMLVVQLMDLRTVGAIDVWSPYVNFRMAWNRGVNFGLFSSNTTIMRWVLIAVAIGIASWVAVWVLREGSGWRGQISAGLLIGGAAGNVIDRLVYGAVADFLNVTCCGFDNPFAFNVADISVFAGAFGLILFTGGKKSA
jgi:signal peptidase II